MRKTFVVSVTCLESQNFVSYFAREILSVFKAADLELQRIEIQRVSVRYSRRFGSKRKLRLVNGYFVFAFEIVEIVVAVYTYDNFINARAEKLTVVVSLTAYSIREP